MQERPWKTSDLLALRDGEPHAVGTAKEDPAVRAELERLSAIKTDLQNMADVPLDDAVWMQHLPSQNRRSNWLRFPLATAASVFIASVIGMYLVFGGGQARDDFDAHQQFAANASLTQGDLGLASLMHQSRDLERQLYGNSALSPAAEGVPGADRPARAPSRSETLLLFRLADVDSEIARLYDNDTIDEQERRRLWMQRVELLQSLVAVQAGAGSGRAGIARSM